MQGLSLNRVVDVETTLAPLAAGQRNFDVLLILGDSDVIDTGEVMREYNDISPVATDFGTNAPEYKAASLYFAQNPKPQTLIIGRWARTATHGLLAGGFLSGAQQLNSAWTGITNGGFSYTVDGGAALHVTGLNFSGITNMNGVASIVSAALTGATATWNGSQFIVKSSSTGTASAIGYFTAPLAGTDISGNLLLTAALASRTVTGIAAETPVAAVARVDGRNWYAPMFAASVMPSDADNIAVAAYIEAANRHIFGIATNEASILDPLSTSDICSQLMLAEYERTFVQYSTSRPVDAVASWFGRAFTTNFEGSNTTLTMMFKTEPGVLPENLTATQAGTLAAKRCNVYAEYENSTAIIEYGVMSGPAYFDEIHGLDWLSSRIQTDLFNILYQAPKIPQTDPGIHVLVTGCESGLSQAVTNGLAAPGRWNAAAFGDLTQGEYLPKGWHIYAPSVDTQDQADREARTSPLIQIGLKLAGAVHKANVLINVNR